MRKTGKITTPSRWLGVGLSVLVLACEPDVDPPAGSDQPQAPPETAQTAEPGRFPAGMTEIRLPVMDGQDGTLLSLEYSGGLIPRAGDEAILESSEVGVWNAVGGARVIEVTPSHVVLRLSAGSAQAASRVRILASPLHRCDLAAASPHDRWAVAPGMDYASISIDAIEICSQAVGNYPLTARFQFQLGRALDAHKQEKPAVTRYRRALLLQPDYPAALMALGGKYVNGEGVERDLDEGMRLLDQAHEMGLARAAFLLARIFDQGMEDRQPDAGKAIEYYQEAAQAGDLHAQLRLAEIHEQGSVAGEKREIEPDSALYWYERAAEQGHVPSQYRLGQAYAQGRGREQDWHKAQRWWDMAANQGLAQAQVALGGIFEDGHVSQGPDFGKAMYWYRQAARQGDAMGQYHLGRMYIQGLGVEKDEKQGREWLQLARNQGVMAADRWLHPWGPGVGPGPVSRQTEVATPETATQERDISLRQASRWQVDTQGYMDGECREALVEELDDLEINVVSGRERPQVRLVVSINNPEYYSSHIGPFRFSGYEIRYRAEVIRLSDNIRMFYTHGEEDGDDRSESCVDAIDEIMDELEDAID